MKRKDIIERLNNLFEEKKKDLKKKKAKKEKKEGKKGEAPYVEDADIEDKNEKKKMPTDKGTYKSLSSSGISDSTMAEEQLDESRVADFMLAYDDGQDDREQGHPENHHYSKNDAMQMVYSKGYEDRRYNPEKALEDVGRKMKRGSHLKQERIEESIDPKIKKEIDDMRKKRKDEIEILMALDKKHGKKLSQRDMEEIAEYISND